MDVELSGAGRLSCRSMKRFLRSASFAALVAVLSPAARAQSFAVGAGGAFVNDTGTAANVGAFDFTEFHAFGELALDRSRNALLQIRYARFGLPRGADDAPNLDVDAGLITVGYLFRDGWWQGGFQGGLGLYHVVPRPPEGGQTRFDPREDVVGWHGGVVTVFDLGPRLDLRLEATFHDLRTETDHRPILVGGGVTWRF